MQLCFKVKDSAAIVAVFGRAVGHGLFHSSGLSLIRGAAEGTKKDPDDVFPHAAAQSLTFGVDVDETGCLSLFERHFPLEHRSIFSAHAVSGGTYRLLTPGLFRKLISTVSMLSLVLSVSTPG